MREKIRLYVNVLLLMFVILAVLSLFFSVRNMTEIRSVSAYEDQGVYTFVPVEVSPVQEENNASGRMRRNHPVKTVYVVSYQASDGSGYEYDYEAGSVDTIAQKIVEEGEPIERRVFSVPDEGTASCIYTQKGNKKIRKPQAANQKALIFDRRAAARLLSINSIRRLCWS